ncbi:hypothetical protein [Maridesulfovibrio sp.]|uniref:hypothetical protein n=1 Tax=Maridesulfovibrio sp. TaxID=2795000 RepID=UPI0039EE0BE6
MAIIAAPGETPEKVVAAAGSSNEAATQAEADKPEEGGATQTSAGTGEFVKAMPAARSLLKTCR